MITIASSVLGVDVLGIFTDLEPRDRLQISLLILSEFKAIK